MHHRGTSAVLALFLTAVAGQALALTETDNGRGGPVGMPDVYVCTADATVLRVSGKLHTRLVAKGSGSFDDCVFGPDGLLYISNGTQIVRTGVSGWTTSTPAVVVGGLPSEARGLAFNGNTLYISTAAHGVYTLAGTTLSAAFPAHAGEGRGLAFEINGTFAAAYSSAGGSSLQRAPYQYGEPAGYLGQSPVNLGTVSARGIAVNTCGDVVYTDATTGTVGRVLKQTHLPGSPVAIYSGRTALNVEIDSSNRHYVLLADDDTGLNPRVVRADPQVSTTDGQEWITNCETFTSTELVCLTGMRAVGLAIGPSAHRLAWNRDALEHVFDFGYHQAAYQFDTAASRAITVTAYRTLPSYVQFSSAFPAGAHPLPYSPLGGLAVQLVLKAAASPFPLGLVNGSYSYYTQEALGKIGIGRAVQHYVGPPSGTKGIYTEDVQHDLWDLGDFDARSGEAENDFSKRVIYNAPPPGGCTIESFSEPFESQNPLFNVKQTIPLTVRLSGRQCRANVVRLSIVRLVDATNPTIETQTVQSKVQTDNVFTALGNGRFKFLIDTSSLNTAGATAATPARFLLTVWGDVAPASRTFEITK
jgi:hypothetical protein